MAGYYEENALRANPTKTQESVFYLKNKLARRKLKGKWQGNDFEYTDFS